MPRALPVPGGGRKPPAYAGPMAGEQMFEVPGWRLRELTEDAGRRPRTELPGAGKATRCQLSVQTGPHPARRWVWHHVLPQACGGLTVAANLAQLCDSCFPGDVLVEYGQVQRASRRWYDGPLVQVRLNGDRELTGTPNHPVLTGCGWLALGQVQEGDYLVAHDRDVEPAVREGDVDRAPAVIGQVFDALAVAGRVRVPAAGVDFHGERPQGDVDVVPAYRQLRPDLVAAPGQLGGGGLLPAADAEADALPGPGGADQLLLAAGTAPASRMRGGSEGEAFLGRHPVHAQLVSLPASAPPDSVTFKEPFERAGADTCGFRQPVLGFPGQVALNQATRVRRVPFAGHVYNLQTATGTYTANGIVVHNCHYAVHDLMWRLAQGTPPAELAGPYTRAQLALATRGYEEAVAAGTAGKMPKEA